jgi:Undecaprenyl-phosphate glucose phosphotransferase
MSDFLIVVASGALCHWVWLLDASSLGWPAYLLVALFGALLAVNFMQFAGGYRWQTLCSVTHSLRHALLAWASVVAILLVLAFLTKTSDQFSRAWLVLWSTLSAGAICVSRVVLYFSVLDWKSQGRLRRNVAIVGIGPTGQRLTDWIVNNPGLDITVAGLFDDRVERSPHFCWGIPRRGNVDDLIRFVRDRQIDMVIVTLPLSAEERLTEIFGKLKTLPVDVRLCPDAIGFQLENVQMSHLGPLPLINVVDRPLSDWRWTVKNVEDRVLASLILLFAGPLMLFIALAIKLDSRGPAIFRQKRFGFNNQLIDVFKFRTMYHEQRDENAEQLTRKNDPRVTRVGAFLRKTSLDELPQFLNVLRGEMSIVGPRPHACRAKAGGLLYQEAVEKYEARHRVKPGITGWAQVNGWRGETETVEQIRKRVEHDLAYIENWSIGLDLKIILRTAFTGFIGRRAY